MRILGGVLAALIVLIQYPLWLGKGGWLRVWEVDRQLEAQRGRNAELLARNRSLDAEVLDLKWAKPADDRGLRGRQLRKKDRG